MVITNMKEEHAKDIARLHVEGIRTGFISSLGIDFVGSLYRAIIETESSFGFVAEGNGRLFGFVALSANLDRLYRTVILKHASAFSLLLSGKMFSFGRLRSTVQTLFYPSRTKKMDLPRAELLSIVVAENERRKGVATALVRKSFIECSLRAIEQVKVLVGAGNEPANTLYLKCGFQLADRINNHGVASNVYIAETGTVLNMLAPEGSVAAEKPRPVKPQIIGIPGESTTDERMLAKRIDE
jgi:ribosomal protein S18 acetylase RimI-like enzyme